jgi:hypothetical protein
MKQLLMVLVLILICRANGEAQRKTTYEFPEAMPETVKTENLKLCNKGNILWQINCAKCHNTKVKRRIIIPDFTSDQLKGYELRVLNPTHESNIPETTVTAEELGLIMTFLTYKKKNRTSTTGIPTATK